MGETTLLFNIGSLFIVRKLIAQLCAKINRKDTKFGLKGKSERALEARSVYHFLRKFPMKLKRTGMQKWGLRRGENPNERWLENLPQHKFGEAYN